MEASNKLFIKIGKVWKNLEVLLLTKAPVRF